MLKRSLLISFALIFALCPQVVLGNLDAATWGPIKEKLSTNPRFEDSISEFENILKNARIFQKYPVTKYLGSGTWGVVFDVESKDNNLVAKILMEKDDNFELCKRNVILAELKSQGASYVNEIKDIDVYTGTKITNFYGRKREESFHVCISILEKADADLKAKKIFEKDSKENWPAFFRFFGKLIQSFAEINFKGKVLHGDIKPANIMVKVSKKGNPLELDVEPVIIDFDLILKNKNEKSFSDEQLRYAIKYRPKEMAEITAEKGYAETDAWYKNWQKYKYSGEFLEDSYALGATILEILKLQSKNVDDSSKEYKKLKELAKVMAGPVSAKEKKRITKENPEGYIKLRPNTKEALGEFLEIFDSCATCLKSNLTIEFFKNAKTSLEQMNKMLIRI